jgi:hypothetical protein
MGKLDFFGRIATLNNGGGTVTGSGTTNYVSKWDSETAQGISQIFDNGINVLIGATSATSNAEKLRVKTATGAYGLVHDDGTVQIVTYVDEVGGWVGTASNHPLYFFVNNGGANVILRTDQNLEVETNLLMSNADGSGGMIIFEGATNNSHQTSLTVIDPTADRTISLPNATGTVALESAVSATYTTITSITVTNGIVTDIQGS